MLAAGVDAAGRLGWVSVVVDDDGIVAVHVAGRIEDLIGEVEASLGRHLDAIGVDIPINLVDGPRRVADVAARRFVGARRASSVFPAPHPGVVSAVGHADANARLVALGFPRVSIQAFHLFGRVAEVADAAASDRRIIEVFPEASFRALAGAPLAWSKKCWNGCQQRIGLLAAAAPALVLPVDLGPAGAAAVDDVLDAAAAAWSARRWVRGEALALGDPAEIDARSGRPALVWV